MSGSQFIAVFCLIWLLVSPARAAESVGKVIMARGDVSALQAADNPDESPVERSLRRRSAVFQTDTLVTGANGRLQVRFSDNALLSLTENSRMVIHHYQQRDEDESSPEVMMELLEGGFRTLTGSLGKTDPTAYRVDTPVGSIGIRGTHYEARLNDQQQLLVGAWGGTIELTAGASSLLIGSAGDVSFARITSDGQLQPLLEAPVGLSPAASRGAAESSDQQANGAGKDDQREQQQPSAESSTSDPGINNDPNDASTEVAGEAPSPFDRQESSQDPTRFAEAPGPDNDAPDLGDPTNDLAPPSSPDSRLSYAEYQAFLSSQRVSAISLDGESRVGTMIEDDRGQPVFITLSESGNLDIIRFDGSTDAVIQPDTGHDLSWGIWHGSDTQPITVYSQRDSDTATTLASSAVWVFGTPASYNQIADLSGTVTFSGDQGIGLNSAGQVMQSASGQFELDFNTGDIRNGTLIADFGGNDHWQASFDGSIAVSGTNTPFANMTLLSGQHGELELNTEASSFAGFLLGEDASGFAGGFDLIDSLNQQASGAVFWQQR